MKAVLHHFLNNICYLLLIYYFKAIVRILLLYSLTLYTSHSVYPSLFYSCSPTSVYLSLCITLPPLLGRSANTAHVFEAICPDENMEVIVFGNVEDEQKLVEEIYQGEMM